MKLKKITGLFLSGVMVLSLLSGCKDDTAGKYTGDSRMTVTVMTNTYCEDDMAAVEKACPGIDIQWFHWCVNSGEISNGYYEELYNNGTMPDIVLGNNLVSYDNNDSKYFRDLSGEDLLSGINTGLLNNYRNAAGEIYWIPGMVEYTAVALNDAMFQTYGIVPPSDYAGFLAAVEDFGARGIGGISIDFGTAGKSYRAWSVLCALSADLLQSAYGREWAKNYAAFTDDTILDSGENAVWPQIFKRLVELKQAGVFTKEQLTTDTTGMLASLKEDTSPMILMDSAVYHATEALAGRNFTLKPFYTPSESGGWLLVNAAPRYAVSNKVTEERLPGVLEVLSALCSTEVYETHEAGRGGVMDVSRENGTFVGDGNKAIVEALDAGNTIVLTTDDGLNAAAAAVMNAVCAGDATAEQAYDLFVQTVKEARVRKEEDVPARTLFTISGAGYSNLYDEKLGGRPAASAFCNTMLECEELKSRGVDVMIANADLVNMAMLDGEYTDVTAGFLFSNQRLYIRTMTVNELLRIMNRDMYLTHRVLQNLPVMAGAAYEVAYKEEGFSDEELGIRNSGELMAARNSTLGPKPYKVTAILQDGRPLAGDTELTVAATRVEMFYLADTGTETTFEGWEDFSEPFKFCHLYLQKYLQDGGKIAKPVSYLTVKQAE